MFEGVPDQFHQFLANSSRTSLPLPLSFPPAAAAAAAVLHGATNFDPSYTTTSTSSSSHQVPLHHHPNFLHPLHQPTCSSSSSKHEDKQVAAVAMAINNSTTLEIIERERSLPLVDDLPWSNDEVLALLRIRSGIENWFPEFTWEHVSRKLAQLGFKRSAEKCKEKFEEESRYFNDSISYNKGYRGFNELEELCHGDPPPPPHHHHQEINNIPAAEKNKKTIVLNKPNCTDHQEDQPKQQDKAGQATLEEEEEEDNNNNNNNNNNLDQANKRRDEAERLRSKKRKREKKLEMFKGFCEEFVSKMMAQQEEMHKKLLQDMMKRDEEKVAREEAWKKQELDRMNMELELRAHEQALAGDRQATIINFLKNFTSSSSPPSTSPLEILESTVKPAQDLINPPTQNPNPTTCHDQTKNQQQQGKENQEILPQNPNSTNIQNSPSPPSSALPTTKVQARANTTTSNNTNNNEKDDLGKRWPRDEVLALINLRCRLYNNSNNEDHNKEGGSLAVKAPLWERISQGMMELGYKRSAKRCKEKWENINKYFRKTKDVNKKRSVDSRTCPYFHQLSTLYNQGTLVAPSDNDEPENHSILPDNHSVNNSTMRNNSNNNVAEEGEKSTVGPQVVPSFDFEF